MSSAPARWGWLRTACSANVPNGPKNPTLPKARCRRSGGAVSTIRTGYWSGTMAPVDDSTLRQLLDDLVAGRTSAHEVVARLSRLPFAEVDGALRQGMPEAVYGPGKTPEQCAGIVGELLAHGTGPVLVTRVTPEQVKAVEAVAGPGLRRAGCLLYREPGPDRAG